MEERGWAEVDVRNGRWRVVRNGDGGKTAPPSIPRPRNERRHKVADLTHHDRADSQFKFSIQHPPSRP